MAVGQAGVEVGGTGSRTCSEVMRGKEQPGGRLLKPQ